MQSKTYDVIAIGGGLGGSAIAHGMAKSGASVLVLEAEQDYKDRVHGELLTPWGVAEAKELGVFDAIMEGGGHELPWWNIYIYDDMVEHRDLSSTTRQLLPNVSYFHPDMQEAMVQSAKDAGADVLRGARVVRMTNNGTLRVVVSVKGVETEYITRLVVGADGRASMSRKWGGFHVNEGLEQNMICGVMFENMAFPDDASHIWQIPSLGLFAPVFPQGNGKARSYLVYPATWPFRLSGKDSVQEFINYVTDMGEPLAYYYKAEPIGPMATWSGTRLWVDHPYQKGVALIGSAACTSDPSWGQGMALALRDARVLRDHLLKNDDWDVAGHAYAQEHDRYSAVNKEVETWMNQLHLGVGPEAEAIREQAMPKWKVQPPRAADVLFSGPDLELTEEIRNEFFNLV